MINKFILKIIKFCQLMIYLKNQVLFMKFNNYINQFMNYNIAINYVILFNFERYFLFNFIFGQIFQ